MVPNERDKDRSRRAKRKCLRCVGNSRSDKEAQECKGAWVRGCDLGYSCATCGVLWSCDCFQKIKNLTTTLNVLIHECNVIV